MPNPKLYGNTEKSRQFSTIVTGNDRSLSLTYLLREKLNISLEKTAKALNKTVEAVRQVEDLQANGARTRAGTVLDHLLASGVGVEIIATYNGKRARAFRSADKGTFTEIKIAKDETSTTAAEVDLDDRITKAA